MQTKILSGLSNCSPLQRTIRFELFAKARLTLTANIFAATFIMRATQSLAHAHGRLFMLVLGFAARSAAICDVRFATCVCDETGRTPDNFEGKMS